MWLVLCDPGDRSALWAGLELRSRGMHPVEFVSPMQLVCAPQFEYLAESGEPVRASVTLTSGPRIDVTRLRGTLNRATRVEYPQLRHAAVTDRPYVQAEMDAVFLAWLGALGAPLFNPPQTSGWAGPLLHPFAWALQAQRAGFTTMACRCGYAGLEVPVAGGPTSSYLVFAKRTFPALPDALTQAALNLSERVRVPLLGITLAWSAAGEANFVGASAKPDLQVGGGAFLDALSAAFNAR
jgi:hypothetical protein